MYNWKHLIFLFELRRVRIASPYWAVIVAIVFWWASFSPAPVFAADMKRQVDLELEEVPGATSYEIELTSKNSGKAQAFKMKTPTWKASIRPGEYTIRMRSYDARSVPGTWSEPIPFLVKLPGPQLLEPAMATEIKTKQKSTFEVEFKWQAVPGTKHYRVTVTPEGEAPLTSNFDEAHGKIELPVAKKYNWTVVPVSKSSEEGEAQDPSTFTLIGGAIEIPNIEKPEDIWVEKLKWEKPEFADKFTYLLQLREENGKWKKIDMKPEFTETEIPFPLEYAGGKYRLAVKADGLLREPSKIAKMEFDVFTGDRSPAAVEESKLRYSLEKPTPWYFVASYLITEVNYTGFHPEGGPNRTVTYTALGGTGRLGLGYIHPKNNSGYLGIVDLSGMKVANQNVTYAAAEGHYIKRYTWGRNLFRPSAGVFYKELIETQSSTTNEFEHQKVTYAGPHVGFDFWRPFNSKLGVQLNARIYYGLIGLDSPNGRDQAAEMSYQIGLMGSYKIRPNITGFMGWAHRQDKATYESTPLNPPSSFASPGSEQRVQIEGDFFNLLMEWGF